MAAHPKRLVLLLSTLLLACWCPFCFELWYKDNDLFPNNDTKFGFSSNQISFLTLSRLDSIRYAIYSLFYFPIPKGRFFLCVSNALIHWSLCRYMPKACPYVVMWFAPSLIVAGMNHRISSRLTQIQRDSTRRLFVGICGDLWFGFKTTNLTNHTNIFLLNPRDYSCWILLNLCEGFLFVEGEWREIFCVNGVGDFDVPWFFCIFVIIKLSQAWMRLY